MEALSQKWPPKNGVSPHIYTYIYIYIYIYGIHRPAGRDIYVEPSHMNSPEGRQASSSTLTDSQLKETTQRQHYGHEVKCMFFSSPYGERTLKKEDVFCFFTSIKLSSPRLEHKPHSTRATHVLTTRTRYTEVVPDIGKAAQSSITDGRPMGQK